MVRPISHKEFLPEYEMYEKDKLQFENSIVVNRGVHPFKRKYLPFYEQMTTQLTALLKQYTHRNFVKYFDFSFRTRAYTRTGEPYMEELIIQGFNKVFLRKSTVYRGEFHKLHKEGFAYGRVSMYNKIGLNYSTDIWFRWKSNIPGYEYIEPDDELDLKSKDITFEICTQIPEEYILRFYAKSADEYDCNEWIAVINDEHHYPRKRNRKQVDFLCEISENCQYPDTTFTLFFNSKVTQSIQDDAISAFVSFQEEWDTTHFFGIHDIAIAEDQYDSENVIKILVDFGSSDYKIMKALIKWLRYSSLDINRIEIS